MSHNTIHNPFSLITKQKIETVITSGGAGQAAERPGGRAGQAGGRAGGAAWRADGRPGGRAGPGGRAAGDCHDATRDPKHTYLDMYCPREP